jgi:hypothetical protein
MLVIPCVRPLKRRLPVTIAGLCRDEPCIYSDESSEVK